MPGMGMIHYDIDDDLHRQAKSAAALKGQTLKDWLIALIEEGVVDNSKRKRGSQ